MKLRKLSLAASLLLVLVFSQQTSANITGTVFRDYNVNSQKDVTEVGVASVTVNAYDDAGTVAATATTDTNGDFVLATVAGSYRIELATIPNGLKSTANTGSGASSVVQPLTFNANDGDTGLVVGLASPLEYVNDNADVITNFHVNGDPSGGSSGAASVLKILPQYKTTEEDNIVPNVTDIATAGDLGSTWGLAYDRVNQIVYLSAVLRRHIGVGSQGVGGIYRVDISDRANPVISNFTTIANVGVVPANTARNLSTDPNQPSRDPVFDEIGRVGLGDLDISEDGTKLYTINLNTNELIEIEIANPGNQTAYAINDPFGACADVRSWGITAHNGSIYIGSVCTDDLTKGAAVSKLTAGTFSTLHTKPLNFRGEVSYGYKNPDDTRWVTWYTDPNTDFGGVREFAQPILSDIEFDENENIILAFSDRSGYQGGRQNYSSDPNDNNLYNLQISGDMNLVCNVNGVYFNEGTVECPYNDDDSLSNGTLQTEDLEYFLGDEWYNSANNVNHAETFLGGIAYASGSKVVISTTYDALKEGDYYISGLSWHDTGTGLKTGAKNLAGGAADPLTYLAKAGGIGDIELLSDPAPIEIGNYVWDDADSDGIQDPSEAAISSVVVTLYDGVTEVGSATTDANGYYYFGGLLDTNMTTPLKYATAYQLRIDLADAALAGKTPTTQDANTNGENQRDSDGDNGTLNAGFSTIAYTTGGAGENDHQQDFGFRNAAVITGNLDITKTVTGGVDPQSFSLQLDCSDNAFDDAAISLASGATHTVNNIPTGTTCSVTETAPSAPSGFTYGAAIIMPTVTIGDATTVTITVENPLTASVVCSVTPIVTTACDDAGTPNDSSDDIFSYTINTSGSNIGASYNISGDDTQNTLAYNIDNTFSGFAINGASDLSLTVADVDDNTCSSPATAIVPATCSNVVATPIVDLEVTKTATPTTTLSGDTVIYTIVVKNNGPDDATGVEVTDQLPVGVAATGNNVASVGTYTVGTGLWVVGALANQSTETLTIEVTID